MHNFDLRNPVWQWWLSLSLISLGNIAVWLWVRRTVARNKTGHAEDDRLQHRMVIYAGIYVFVCAFRSVVPRADVQRITLFDSWIATVAVGRAAATLAELSFVAQWSLALQRVGKVAGAKWSVFIAHAAVPAIAVAECFSWYAVISTNYLGNCVEESIWALTGLCAVFASSQLFPRYRGNFQRVLGLCALSALGYFFFMIFHDVPMYVGRFREGLLDHQTYFTLLQGLHDVATRRVVTYSIDDWREEIPWMSFYFSLSVWFSTAICLVNLRTDEVRRFLSASPVPAQALPSAAIDPNLAKVKS